VQAQLTAVNPEQQTYNTVSDLDTWISDEPEWQQEHLAAWIFSVFAWLALALAAVGLYSVVSYTVAQRTKEFGIRIALGAPRGHMLWVVLTSTLGSVGSGVLVGTLLLSLVSGIACAIPARHASKVDPMTALRCE
jgi:ABC-type antimicrobial peptide transport system permease subunit